MLSQGAIASTWGPRCYKGPKLAIRLNGSGVVTVRAQIADGVLALDACLRAHNYKTRARDTGALVCRHKTGSAVMSNHSYGTALDINWGTNPYGRRLKTDMSMAMVTAICSIRTRNGAQVWNWGGFWDGHKDAMHYEVVCGPKDIATGIDPRTVPGAPTAPPQPPTVAPAPTTPVAPRDEEDEMRIIQHVNGAARLSHGGFLFDLTDQSLRYYRDDRGVTVDVCNQAGWDFEHSAHGNGNVMKRSFP